MATVFDAEALRADEHAEAFRAAVVHATVPSTVGLSAGPAMRGRLEAWHLGTTVVNRTSLNVDFSVSRDRRQVRQACVPQVSFAMTPRAAAVHEQFGGRRMVAPGQLTCIDLTSPYHYMSPANGDSRGMQITLDDLDLPADMIRRASLRLPSSPVYDLMRTHVGSVSGDPDRFAPPGVAAAVGRASVELARALLLSAAGETGAAGSWPSLLPQVRAYVAHHLADPELGPDRIAAALNVSVRHLFAQCRRAGLSLEQSIIQQRLAKVREDLADPAWSGHSVGSVARRWGFRHPAHFSRRFRAAYGMTPTAWRAAARDLDD